MAYSASLPLVLASTSVYRAALLTKLTTQFTARASHVDETPQHNEAADILVQRLALAKAQAVASQLDGPALIIGSDQVALFENDIIGKPLQREAAIAQLSRFSGHSVSFLTGLALYNSLTGHHQVIVEPFTVHFRTLSQTEIAAYVDKEQPFDCAGSFKSEGLGISLFRKLEGDDPNSLIGLPLIRLFQLLQQEGVNLLLS